MHVDSNYSKSFEDKEHGNLIFQHHPLHELLTTVFYKNVYHHLCYASTTVFCNKNLPSYIYIIYIIYILYIALHCIAVIDYITLHL